MTRQTALLLLLVACSRSSGRDDTALDAPAADEPAAADAPVDHAQEPPPDEARDAFPDAPPDIAADALADLSAEPAPDESADTFVPPDYSGDLPSACNGLDACACETAGCQRVTYGCSCPSDFCMGCGTGCGVICLCGGGPYLGCAPQGCPGVLDCAPGCAYLRPDGCLDCQPGC